MALVILIHALVFLAFWLTNLAYQKTLNDFLIGTTGWQANFLLLFMLFSGAVALWSAARLVMRRTRLDRIYLVIGILFLAFFYGSFIFLFVKNPVQLYRLGQLFQYFRLFVDAALLLALAWILPGRVKKSGLQRRILLPAALLVLWLIPLAWNPGNVYHGALPRKPDLIAHRGAATMTPENTLVSMQTAADLGVYGLETDISVSVDGVLFLMHDSTLARTTNVAQVFPGRENAPAETFTWKELSQLDAGGWYDEKAFAGEPIPTLKTMLAVVKKYNLFFIYDLRIPSAGHPYTAQALDLCLEEIKAAGVSDHAWILAKGDAVAQIRRVLPDARLAVGIGYTDVPPSPSSLVAEGYQVVNSTFGLSDRAIRAYREAGLWVNLWVVDEPWQYSRLWLVGADSVASNNVQDLLAMRRPVLGMTFEFYIFIWSLFGLIAAGVCWWAVRRQSP